MAWVREDSRSRSLAGALGGESRTFFDLGIHRKWLVPFRYVLSAVRMLAYLVRRRPRAVIIQVPPVPAAVIVCAWARLTGARVVLDTHPAAFGYEQARADRLMRPLLASLTPRTAGCIVTTPRLGEQIREWGGRPLVVHEAPMPWSDRARPLRCADGRERRVLFVCTFAPDEPVAETLQAAARLPDVTFAVTGDLRRRGAEIEAAAPDNVRWVGYLGREEYVAALAAADVIVSLSTRADSVARSAHEAVDALRPLVLSDWPHMKALFPYAVFVKNEPDAIAKGVREALRRCEELSGVALEARSVQRRRWAEQLAALSGALGLRPVELC